MGIRDKALPEKLQLEHNLSLERAINFVRQKESVRKLQSVLGGEANQQLSVDIGNNRDDVKPRNRAQSDTEKSGRYVGPQHPRKDCPAGDFSPVQDEGSLEKGPWKLKVTRCRR